MNKATRLELTAASLLVVHAIDLMEPHHDMDDLDAAVQGVLVRALELACAKQLRPIEEMFSND